MEAGQMAPIFVLTPRALERVRLVLQEQGAAGCYLEVNARPAGCREMEYELGLIQTPAADQLYWQQEGVGLCIGLSSARYLLGASLDFVEGEAEEGFKFSNPNLHLGCNCDSPQATPC